jgi:hypothetical protein
MLLTFICLFLVVELKRDWYSIQTLLGLLYQNRNMQSASPQGVHACFFFLLSQTGFVWLPCVCVIFFQSGIAVIVWDFPEWRRLCFTEISTFLLFNFLLTASAHLLLGVTSNSLNFKFYISICVSILTCCEYLIFSDLFNRNIWITEHQPELQQHPEWITVLTLFYHTIRWGWPPCWG